MKQFVFIVLIALCALNVSYAQNWNWITPNQTYLKVYVIDDGIYRINKSDFTAAGINTSTIDPRTVKVYYKGNQAPIFFYGEQDGVFNDTDYFDFYGQRNYGGLTNAYNSNNQVLYTTDEYFNQYSDTNVYWIGWEGSYGLRFSDYTYSSGIAYSPNYYYKKLHFENDLLYSFGENIDVNTDFRNFNNERFQGEGWYWLLMAFQNTLTQNFTSPYLSPLPANCKLKIFAYPYNQNTSLTYEHALTLRLNNILIDTLYTNHFDRIDTTIYFPSTLLNVTGNNAGSVKYTPNTSFTGGRMYFDMFEISYPKSFSFDSNKVSYSTGSTDSTSKIFKISGYVTSNGINIYDVKNGYRMVNYSVNADTLIFTGKGNGSFEVINSYITKKPMRLKQRMVPNLVTNSTGVDYLVIYNKLFEVPAEQLRAYRVSHNNYRSFKAEMEDIYDIFNSGTENPVAIRNFVRNTYNYWTAPKLKFICLFGRGSVDPKKILASDIYYQNLVPVYGNPPTDGYYSNLNVGTFSYYQQIPIGRLPAYTLQEAQDIVNKIEAYESQSPDKWLKQTIFIAGGYNSGDQQTFRDQSDYFQFTYLTPPPLALSPVKIYLTDSSGLVTYNYADSVKNSINRGALYMNYIGHAGNGYWDYCYADPSVYSNGSNLPLIYSMTCFTGKDAEASARGFGEKFLTYPNKGAIGFISSTGWAFYPTGGYLNEQFVSAMKQDTTRIVGQILSNASVVFGTGSDSGSYFTINTVNSFNLIGDPAVKLLLPPHPEFDIQMTDYKLSNPYPALKENVNLIIYPKNLGSYADSCKIRLQLTKNNLNYKIKDTIVRGFGFIDTINYNFSMDSTGVYNMKIILDADNWYPMENKSNNIINIPVSVKNVAFVPFKPIDNSIIKSDTVVFVGINPNINPLKNNIKLLLQLDTTATFSSPMLSTYFNNNMTGVVTKFRVRIPILDSNIVYYWRMNMIRNLTDSTGWSGTSRFIYNPNITENNFTLFNSKIIRIQNKQDNLTLLDSIVILYKLKPGQYNFYDLNNTVIDTTGIKLTRFTGSLIASSYGGNPWDPSYISINNKSYEYVDATVWGGFHVAKVRKSNGALVDLKHWRFTSTASSDSLLAFLNTFDTTNILMIIKSIPVYGSGDLNTATRDKLRSFGSVYCDTVSQPAWSRWSFISSIGNPNSVVSEAYLSASTAWTPATSTFQPVIQNLSGSVAHLFGPAKSWKNFSWRQVLYSGTTIKFDVVGLNRNNQEFTLYSNLTNNNLVSLDTINAYQYPYLKLITKLNLDSISGSQSPVFKSLKFSYIPPGEIALDNNTYLQSDSIVNSNDTIGLSLIYYNVGFSDFNGVVRNFFVYNNYGQKTIFRSDTLLSVFNVDSMSYLKTKFKVSGIPNYRRYNNSVDFYVEVQPYGQQNDYYYYNNSAVSNIVVKNSPQITGLEILSDGVKLMNGDFVRSKPDLLIKLNGTNRSAILFDTTGLKVSINNVYIPYNTLNPEKSILKIEGKEFSKTGLFVIRCNPNLPNGQNNFKFVLLSSDGNSYDTLNYDVLVSNQLLVKDLANYPNPMKNQTSFIFNLGGDKTPTSCKIKIYSVAGRLIKIIDSPVIIGFNQIHWDGRDQDGDYMANGVYLYKIIIQGDSQTETAIQKLVILK